MRDWRVGVCAAAAAVAVAFAGPALAAGRGRDDAARATQQIEKAKVTIAAAQQKLAPSERPGSRERLILSAQQSLDKAQRAFDQRIFRAAEHEALRAAVLAWRAQAPRKGEE